MGYGGTHNDNNGKKERQTHTKKIRVQPLPGQVHKRQDHMHPAVRCPGCLPPQLAWLARDKFIKPSILAQLVSNVDVVVCVCLYVCVCVPIVGRPNQITPDCVDTVPFGFVIANCWYSAWWLHFPV